MRFTTKTQNIWRQTSCGLMHACGLEDREDNQIFHECCYGQKPHTASVCTYAAARQHRTGECQPVLRFKFSHAYGRYHTPTQNQKIKSIFRRRAETVRLAAADFQLLFFADFCASQYAAWAVREGLQQFPWDDFFTGWTYCRVVVVDGFVFYMLKIQRGRTSAPPPTQRVLRSSHTAASIDHTCEGVELLQILQASLRSVDGKRGTGETGCLCVTQRKLLQGGGLPEQRQPVFRGSFYPAILLEGGAGFESRN